MKFSGLILAFLLSISASASLASRTVTYKPHWICGPETKKYVNDKTQQGVQLSLDEILAYYETCVAEEETPGYEEVCGDRPGGAYDNCVKY